MGRLSKDPTELGLDVGDVEGRPIVGDDEVVPLHGFPEVLQVLVFDEGRVAGDVVDAHHGDVAICGRESGGLDVEEGRPLAEIAVEPPAFPTGQGRLEKSGVRGCESGARFLELGA